MKKLIMIVLTLLVFFTNFNVKAEFERVYNPDDLSDYFGTMKACDHNGGTNDCKNGNEYKFYVKMYDIYYLYKNKYNVKLDLPLIMAALYYGNEELPVVYKKNLNKYNRNQLKDTNVITNLDWEFDFKNDDCYTYLNANDYRFDMQILAKNMVKKEIKYDCVVENEEADEESDEESDEEYTVVDTVTVEDIETSNYSTDTLKCEEGEYDPDSINESYTFDADKYKKFLLEYIKLKYHTKGSEVQSCTTMTSNGDTDSSSNSYDGSGYNPVPLTASGKAVIDKMNQIALAEAQAGTGPEKFQNWYGYSGDWCAMFVSWLFDQVGGIGKYFYKNASAGPTAREPIAAGLGVWLEDECTDPSTVPRAGDVLHWKEASPGYWVDRYSSRHVGYVYAVDDTKIYTVEGNHNPYHVVTVEHDRKDCNVNGYYRANF